MLAGLLYLGAGLGLAVVHTARTALGIAAPEAPLRRRDLPWLFVIIIFGGILGPVLLMLGQAGHLPHQDRCCSILKASQRWASRGWCFMRMLTGVCCWVPWQSSSAQSRCRGRARAFHLVGAAMIAGACICWGIDNNLTRKLSSADPVSIAMIKGLAAGTVNMASGFWLGDALPSSAIGALAALLGFFAIGISLVLFVLALRHLGTARTGAYFSLAPFIGALLALALGEPLTLKLATFRQAKGVRPGPAIRPMWTVPGC